MNEARRIDPYDRYHPLWILAFGGSIDDINTYIEGNPWTTALARYLLDEINDHELLDAIDEGGQIRDGGTVYARSLSALWALGIRAERKGDDEAAIKHYREYFNSGGGGGLDALWVSTRLARWKENKKLGIFKLPVLQVIAP